MPDVLTPTAIELRQPTLPLEPTTAAPAAEVSVPAASPPAVMPKPAEGAATPASPAAPEVIEPKIELTTDKPTLLEKHIEAEAEKTAADAAKAEPDAAKPEEIAKPVEPEAAKPAEAAPPTEPVKFEFKLPEALKTTPADNQILQKFTTILGAPKSPQETGQALLDLHAEAMEQYSGQVAKDTLAEQHRVFNRMRDNWSKDVLADPEIGGAGHRTAMSAIARARDMLVSSARPGTPKYQSDIKAFDDFLRITGAGDHPVFLKVLHNAARYFDEPALPPENAQPPKDNGKAPGKSARVLYDNPRSNPNRQ